MDPVDISDVATSIVTALGGIGVAVPVVIAGGLAVGLFFWGAKKLVGLFKSVAK